MSDSVARSVRVIDAASPNSGFVPMSFARLDRSTAASHTSAGSERPTNTDRYALGFEEGRQAAEEAFETERAAMLRLVESAGALQPESSDELAMLIGETVYRLVTDIVGKVEIDHECLSRRASAAAALVAECDNARTLYVNPDDLALLEGMRSNLTVEGDPSLPRGDVRIDCSAGWIEHGTSLYLEGLRSELGLMDNLS